MRNSENKKTILVTGSAGFIGFHTAKKLLEDGFNVIGIDSINNYYSQDLKNHRNDILKKYNSYKFYQLDISEEKELEKVFEENNIDKICHLAAQPGVRYSIENPLIYQQSNLKGFINIMECAKKFNIKDFIYASSSSVYGKNEMNEDGFKEEDNVDSPISLYAATKKSNELIAHNYHHLFDINCTGLRFFTAYGPSSRPDMAMYLFTNEIMNNKEVKLFNYGKMLRDFTYVDDIVDGIIKSLEKAYPYEIFNLGNSQTVEVGYLIKLLEENLNKKANIKLEPIQPGDVEKTFANISKAKKMLNYDPKTNIEEGVKKFVEWYKEYYKI
ncbi:protein CapI [Candidatus Falkowbacteria bacterium HGW-Falkowbacteria-1]|jgi:UDP-glucuronate 4-epimerase|uniref:Protein CapI n=1 Tax=Candidatus Falkowbacteria bacterium HGW-Falkowbacteria-1 TaxID=2013768 RepID=A0A2N2EAX4_9BACT|nr:MAG: protein CapI [Candidatus Falkowbacteria bacterium HGW-Falkowbacteria-1]